MAHTGSKHATTDILPFVRGNVNLRKGRKKVSNKCHRRSNLLYNNDAALITKNKTARITYVLDYARIHIAIYNVYR
ncbi:hypothetical protein WH47_01886 [Habropoda laboriosa]|uniref:Uncharacterized protein n=1 Tax=Habropoda laboriosa TaxID=597456 RepID=A0A0L7QXQ8_9HYME|nr:hypothetical protein WH47_01886 [Habropoda laboriosa]